MPDAELLSVEYQASTLLDEIWYIPDRRSIHFPARSYHLRGDRYVLAAACTHDEGIVRRGLNTVEPFPLQLPCALQLARLAERAMVELLLEPRYNALVSRFHLQHILPPTAVCADE